jgi:hypothetical protein
MARDTSLNKLDNRLIGRQFFRLETSPFFSINFIAALLKLEVSVPLTKQVLQYLNKGILIKDQYSFIKTLLIPSMPGADFMLAFSMDLSSSSMDKGRSSSSFSVKVSLLFWTRGWATMSSPRNSSTHP